MWNTVHLRSAPLQSLIAAGSAIHLFCQEKDDPLQMEKPMESPMDGAKEAPEKQVHLSGSRKFSDMIEGSLT